MVPAVVNVLSNDPPVAMLPLSKLPATSVTVCGAESVLVQVTVPPTFKRMVSGEKAKPTIFTVPAVTRVGVVAGGV